MKTLLLPYFIFVSGLDKLLFLLRPLALLAARCYVGWVFFSSGLLKIKDWDSTLFLFEEEYAVPFLSPEVAAYLGTGSELLLPVLLVLGLLNPVAVIGLSILNVTARLWHTKFDFPNRWHAPRIQCFAMFIGKIDFIAVRITQVRPGCQNVGAHQNRTYDEDRYDF